MKRTDSISLINDTHFSTSQRLVLWSEALCVSFPFIKNFFICFPPDSLFIGSRRDLLSMYLPHETHKSLISLLHMFWKQKERLGFDTFTIRDKHQNQAWNFVYYFGMIISRFACILTFIESKTCSCEGSNPAKSLKCPNVNIHFFKFYSDIRVAKKPDKSGFSWRVIFFVNHTCQRTPILIQP